MEIVNDVLVANIYIYPLFKPRVAVNEVPSTRLQLEMAVYWGTAVHTTVTSIALTLSPSTVLIKMDPVPATQKNVLQSWPPRTVVTWVKEL